MICVNFLTPSIFNGPSAEGYFCGGVGAPKTTMMGVDMSIRLHVYTQYRQWTDRQTDTQK